MARTLDFVRFIHGAAMAVALIGEVPGVRRVVTDHVFLPTISLIAIHPSLVAVQQLTKHLCVMHVRRGGLHPDPNALPPSVQSIVGDLLLIQNM